MGIDVHDDIESAHCAEKIGTELFRKLLPQLKAKQLTGKYIAVKVPSGEYLIASTEIELMDLCDKNHWGDAPAWVQRIEDDEPEQNDRSGRPS